MYDFSANGTVAADVLTEFIRFEPEICICKGNYLEFKRESVSVRRDFRLKFPQICLCNGDKFFCQHDSVSVIENYHLTENYYIINSETIVDVNNYIPFSILNSQTIDVM